ncbi:metallophosphoesterase family protein [Fodinibius sediminis]|uniref:DNA repair exonuclease SbcCD nuclease subunit n=1 Tax=Fodinibius sediminis TaxID=1214077 RepID=A0A521FB42_9BACT|nr:DNA repair exonuclease [Fodinibius sediminis]SMO93356.1 DNA repair exonuclease SbcCD nuclease subunit [Fodinibius sediminis]
MKIFHIADLHLGRTFRNLPEAQDTLSEARYETLQKTIDKANELESDLFVIAGDLFDRTSMKVGDIQEAVRAINQFTGEVVLVLPGNHDYITADSQLWDRFKKESEEHVLVLDEKEPLKLSVFEPEVVVYPAPCHAKHSAHHAIEWVNEIDKDEDALHIGVAHGSIEGVSPDFDQRYFPMSVHELEQSGTDLWLMGHTHITWPEHPDKRDMIFNPGTPEPDGFSCNHEGRAFLHTVGEDQEIKTEIISTGTYRFIQKNEQISSIKDVQGLVDQFGEDSWQQAVVELKISGKLEEEAFEAWQESRSQIRESVLELRLEDNEVRRKVTSEQIQKEFSKGSFPEQLLSSFSEDEEEEELQMAYELIKEVQQ